MADGCCNGIRRTESAGFRDEEQAGMGACVDLGKGYARCNLANHRERGHSQRLTDPHSHISSGDHQASQHVLLDQLCYDLTEGKGYGTEALQLMVDYLFLTKEIHRVQANTDPQTRLVSTCWRK
jgi:hypothetical protein